MRIVRWDTEETARKELSRRLQNAQEERKKYERQWKLNEKTLQNTGGDLDNSTDYSVSFESKGELDTYSEEDSIGINYAFKNTRFIHSQLSANPPTVVARPTSNDAEDRRKADTADRLVRYAIRQYKLQEVFDKVTLNCLYYGNGILKVFNDSTKGSIVDLDPETGELTMEGDISFKVVSPWNIFVDPDADSWDEVKHVFERMFIPWEEAVFQFPDKRELLEELRQKEVSEHTSTGSQIHISKKYDVVEVYQYWEKGLPHNGMQGRFGYMLPDGTPLTTINFNPHAFSDPVEEGEQEMPPIAELPYHLMTDLDIPSEVWGKATVDYEAPLQDTLNKMTNVMLDCLRAHGVARILLPEGAEIADESITNSPMDIIKFTGGPGNQPNFMEPMPFPPAFGGMMEQIKQGINDSAGVNDAMFGQVERETSGFSLQYATNQGNMIRRRLFNKYVLLTESVYKTFLSLVRKHWDTPRKIQVLGTEKAFNVVEIDATDVTGGFDLVVEYGASLSLDPTTRREEILTLAPMFKEAGVSSRKLLSMLKLNELEGLYDEVQMAEDRQYEIFKEMEATQKLIEPGEKQDHENMLAYAKKYIMTSEFKYLDEDTKQLIIAHTKLREAKMQEELPQPAPAGGGIPGLADPTAGMTGQMAGVEDLGALLGG